MVGWRKPTIYLTGNNMIKLVLIDIDNTLLDFAKCAQRSITDGFVEAGLEYYDDVFKVFNEVNNGLWLRVENREITKNELFGMRWNMIFARLGISFDGEKFENMFFERLSESVEEVDGAKELLKYLSRRYIVCAASNSRYDQQERRMKKSGMSPYLDRIFVSERVGAEKPDPAFFRACLSEFPEIGKDETIMIGDSPTADVAGGVTFGIKTCWFDPFKSGQTVSADYTVHSLDEIKNIL